jgi:phosphoribosylglycinamide formyltransferase 1
VIRVAILISGGGSNMAALMRDMQGDHPGRTVLVLSNVPGAGGLAVAEAAGVPVAVADHRGIDREAFEVILRGILMAARPDVVCLAGFMRVLSPAFVAEFAGRMMNIHPSLLPKYPGLHTHARALAAGDAEAGCTVHEVTKDLDAGRLLGQARVPVLAGDDEGALQARVLAAEHLLYPAVLRRFVSGDRTPVFL